MPFVILLEARDDAQVRVALRTMVLGLPTQNPAVGVHGVPTVVAAQRRSRTDHRTVARPGAGLKAVRRLFDQ